MKSVFDDVDKSVVPAVASMFDIEEERARKLVALTQFVKHFADKSTKVQEKQAAKQETLDSFLEVSK